VKTMKYQKPEIIVLRSATAAIQGHKGSSMQADSATTFVTSAAYQADE
jgi:hypothetical protein